MPFNKTTWTDDITYLSAENMNDIENAIDGNRLAPTAGGTGTAITVTAYQFTLTDGCIVSFVASADNSGAATTINVNGLGAKSAYKANTTDAPTIVSGRMYTFWYSTGSTCFFLRAAATGDFVAAELLDGKIGSNDTDTDVVGTMPNNAGDNACLSSSVSSTTLKLVAPEGYFDGSDDTVTLTDADFVATNIPSGVTLFGLAGTRVVFTTGGNTLATSAVAVTTTSATYVKRKQVTIAVDGTYNVNCTCNSANAGTVFYLRIYKNGIAYGAEFEIDESGVGFSETLAFAGGDTCEWWMKKGTDSAANIQTASLMTTQQYTFTNYTD